MSKLISIIRDISLFVLFLVFSKQAFERSIIHMEQEKPSPWKKFDVHELDKGFLAAITVTQQHINEALSLVVHKNDEPNKKKLEEINKKIEQIEKKYKKNSPATYLLGPLGTASIVLKEKRLEKELRGIIENLGTILYALNESNTEDRQQNIEISSLESGIIRNKGLLGSIPHSSVLS